MNFFSSFPKALLLSGLLLSCQSVAAQATEAEPAPKNVIKVAPFAFIHGQLPFTVESRIGYERVIGPNSSVMGSYSYMGTNYPFGFLTNVAFSATLSAALNLYGKPGKVGIAWSETDIDVSGYRYQLQFKQYLSKRHAAPEGFYLSPHYSNARVDYSIDMKDLDIRFKIKARHQNYNLLAGYQAILGKHFVLDVFSGLGYRNNSKEVFTGENVYLGKLPKGTRLKISTGFNLGWAF